MTDEKPAAEETPEETPEESTADVPAEESTTEEPTDVPEEPVAEESTVEESTEDPPAETRKRKLSGAGVAIGVLLALFGFTLVVQLRSNATDAEYASARESDLVTLLSDLNARETRLQQDIAALQEAKRQLLAGSASRDKILEDAKERANDLGILAGTLPARGPGVTVRLEDGDKRISASQLTGTVQELRAAGAEAMQIDSGSQSVRIIASTYFVDVEGGVKVDGQVLSSPYTITAIGKPENLSKGLDIHGGVISGVRSGGGKVTVSEHPSVDVKTTRRAPNLEYAQPV